MPVTVLLENITFISDTPKTTAKIITMGFVENTNAIIVGEITGEKNRPLWGSKKF